MEKNYDVLISYDINSKEDSVHSFVKTCMIEKGYADQLTEQSTTKIVFLPNTTLWKKSTTAFDARQDLLNCVDDYNRKNTKKHMVERCIALEFTSIWHAQYGEPHSSSSKAPVKERNT